MRRSAVKAAVCPASLLLRAPFGRARSSNTHMSHTELFLQGASNPAGFRDVTPQQLSAATVKPRLVDVREPHEYTGDLGHIEGAELVPMNTAVEAAKTWDRDADVVLICRSGNRSGRVAAALASMGFKGLMNLSGGMLAWSAAALPVKR